jgi:protocatechuate 3,4-dioxygenase beta subunit
MNRFTRRQLVQGAFGLGIAGAGGLLLHPQARATPPSGKLGDYAGFLAAEEADVPQPKDKLAATEDNILGPYHRAGAPFRAKITPPLEAGTVLLISGTIWGLDTRKPLSSVMVDIWQANDKGRYDNDDPKNPPKENVFVNRARLITDENGYYEYETVHPGPYQIGAKEWRPSHIHYLVRARGYKQLVTQLYFKGDPHNKTDRFIKPSLIIELTKEKNAGGTFEAGKFDIVLAPAK